MKKFEIKNRKQNFKLNNEMKYNKWVLIRMIVITMKKGWFTYWKEVSDRICESYR